MSRKKRNIEGCAMDMTPMIDVVFQLIIFFVVTMKMTEEINEDIILEEGKHGEIITAENTSSQTITIEVGMRNLIFRADASRSTMAPTTWRCSNVIRRRTTIRSLSLSYRADYRVPHEDVKGSWTSAPPTVPRVGFIAIQDKRTKAQTRQLRGGLPCPDDVNSKTTTLISI